MPEFGRRMDGLSGRRQRQRSPVTLAASAWAIGRSHSVLVADISQSGARLQGRDFPAVGADLMVTIGSVEVFAKVKWRDDDECGITFDTSFTPEMLGRVRQEGDWALVTGVRR